MSFGFALAYLIVEYVRPQEAYPALSSIPFALITILGLALSFLLEGRVINTRNLCNKLIVAYLVWFFVSYLNAFRQDLALQPLLNFGKLVITYYLLINSINDRVRLYVFTITLLVLNFKYAQFAVAIWAASGFYSDPRGLNAGGGIGSGFFNNPNDFGAAMSSVLGLSYSMIFSDLHKILSLRMKWFHALATVAIGLAILASSSRGSAVGLGATALTAIIKSKHKTIAFVMLCVVALGFVALIPDDNWKRFQVAGSQEDDSTQTRVTAWLAGIRMGNEFPLTGVGPSNFTHVNMNIYMSSNPFVQHNVFIQAFSELGYPGLLLFVGMILGCFYNNRYTRKLLAEKQLKDPFLIGLSHGLDLCLVGFIVNGFFITVLYYPMFWIIMILSVALHDVVQRIVVSAETKSNLESFPTQWNWRKASFEGISAGPPRNFMKICQDTPLGRAGRNGSP